MNIFDLTERPLDSLLYRGHDEINDPRLGSIAKTDIKEIDKCQFVILGCSQDDGVIRNKGRPGAKSAPDKIREWFYKLATNKLIENKGIFDIGNIKNGDSLEETHKNLYNTVKTLIIDKKTLIIIGGGNDISYPDCKALSDTLENKKSLLTINIDKHFDVRNMEPRNSGTPYRYLLNENVIDPKNFVEFGYIPYLNSQIYYDYLKDLEVNLNSLDDIRFNGVSKSMLKVTKNKDIEDIFWGFDIDSINSKDAPGVSSSYPVGFSSEEIIDLSKIAGRDKRSKIVEFTEVNPQFDIDNRTVKLTSILMFNFIFEYCKEANKIH